MDNHLTPLSRAVEIMKDTGLTEKRALGIARQLKENGIVFAVDEEE